MYVCLYVCMHADPLFSKYKCLKFHDLVNLKTLLIVYKAKKWVVAYRFKDMFHKLKKTEDVHKSNTKARSRGNFDLRYCKTKVKSMAMSI